MAKRKPKAKAKVKPKSKTPDLGGEALHLLQILVDLYPGLVIDSEDLEVGGADLVDSLCYHLQQKKELFKSLLATVPDDIRADDSEE